jgi:uncharacterized protein with beta-barrel porin domain
VCFCFWDGFCAGGAAGGAGAKAGAMAVARAVGLDGNDGNDTITNTGSITVRDITAESDAIGISASIGVTNAGVALSAAVADTTANATSTAKGIAGGAGNDTITNQGAILLQNIGADASATSVGVNINAAIQGGVAAGVSLTDASTHAQVNVAGIEGGDGNDVLSNTSTITATNGIESKAHATGVSVGVNVSFAGVAAGASIADTSAHATTTMRGMDGGAGDDTLYNNGAIRLTGNSTADGLSVAVNVSAALGVSLGGEITDASTEAKTSITGIEGGAGRDDIRNDSTITLTSNATAEASSISAGVSLGLGGDLAWADSKSTADATAIGIGDSGGTNVASIIDNRGSITAQSTSSTTGLSVAASLFGLGLGDITNTSNASSYGIRTGDGVDQITNTGAITANANASTSGISISANFGGVVHGDSSTTANATAVGIATGGGNDVVVNTATLDIDATSSAEVLGIAATLAGTARSDVKTQAVTNAIGIDGGDGNDQLSSNANMTGNATSSTNTLGVQVSIFGTAGSDVMNTPTASVTAINAGAGDDTATLAGTVRVESLATATVNSSSWNLAGSIGSRAGVEANASAVGLDGGAGNDVLTNRSTSLLIFATSRATADSTSWQFAGVSGAESALSAHSRVVGLDGGDGDDHLRNEAAFRATAYAQLTTTGGANTIFGNASTNTDIGATSTASGLVGGAGNDLIQNLARIDVSAASIVNSTRTSFSFAGSPNIDELLKAKSTSIGLDGGAGNDTIYNNGRLFVDAYASAISNGSSSASLGGGASASGKAVAEAIAIGLAGGDGDDTIENRNAINADTRLFPQTNNSSSAGVFFGSGNVEGRIKGTLTSSVIDAGDGNNSVYNYGQLFASASTLTDASANTYASGSDFSFFTGGSGNGYSRADLDINAVGIRAGNGNNTVLNANGATISVSMSDAIARAYSDPNGGSTSGSGNGTVESVVSAIGAGIGLGNGTNNVQNDGSIGVVVNPTARASSDVDGTGLDNANGTVNATASGEGTGIRVGNGGYRIVSNSIGVTVAPFAQSFTDVYGGVTGGDGNGYANNYATAKAYGIVAGNGDGYIENNGAMSVVATPYATPLNDRNVHGTGHGAGDAVAVIDSDSRAEAIGIKTGIGTQTVVNNSAMTVSANAIAQLGYGLYVDMSNPDSHRYGTGHLYAEGMATGIQIGGGNASVINRGDITVTATPSVGTQFIDGDGSPYMVKETYSVAKGIEIGAGGSPTNRSVVNDGSINVTASGFIEAQDNGCCFYPVNDHRGGIPTAIGIQVSGSGNTEITNNGTIQVEATALGTLNPAPGAQHVAAYGIYAVDGTHTVVNNGTIGAQKWDGFFFSYGPAITLGNGDDTVGLGATSVTHGDINFGGGNSTLTLTGAPQFYGNFINDTARTFSLVLNDSGSFSHALPTVNNTTKNGPGTYTLPNLNSVQQLTVNQGTLSIQNDYRFSSTGVFQTNVNRDGTYGQLMSGNIATLGGTLNVQRETGAYRNGVSFDVVLADSIAPGSSFNNVVLPAPTTLVTFHSQQLADRVRVTTDVESFTKLATNPEERGIAAGLDLLMSDTSETTNQLLGQAQNLSSEQATVALTTLGPGIYNFHNLAAFSNVHQSANLLQERMRDQHTAELMSAPTTATASKDEPMRLAYNGGDLGKLFDARDAERERSQGVWIRGFSQRGDQDADDNQLNGFRYDLSGLTFGYDQRLSQTFTLGASVGSVKNHLESDANLSDGHVHTGLLSFYGGYFDKETYVNGVLAFGKNRYDTDRNVMIGSSMVPVSSEHDGRVFAATLSGGYYGQMGESFWLGPYASLQYTRLKEDGFTETGSVVALNVQGRATSALISTLGVRAAGAIQAGSGNLIPELSVGWVHDYKIDDQMLSASYVGAPDATFKVEGRQFDRDGVLAGIGVGYRTRDGLTSSLKYNGEFRDGLHVHGLIGELRYEF